MLGTWINQRTLNSTVWTVFRHIVLFASNKLKSAVTAAAMLTKSGSTECMNVIFFLYVTQFTVIEQSCFRELKGVLYLERAEMQWRPLPMHKRPLGRRLLLAHIQLCAGQHQPNDFCALGFSPTGYMSKTRCLYNRWHFSARRAHGSIHKALRSKLPDSVICPQITTLQFRRQSMEVQGWCQKSLEPVGANYCGTMNEQDRSLSCGSVMKAECIYTLRDMRLKKEKVECGFPVSKRSSGWHRPQWAHAFPCVGPLWPTLAWRSFAYWVVGNGGAENKGYKSILVPMSECYNGNVRS